MVNQGQSHYPSDSLKLAKDRQKRSLSNIINLQAPIHLRKTKSTKNGQEFFLNFLNAQNSENQSFQLILLLISGNF